MNRRDRIMLEIDLKALRVSKGGMRHLEARAADNPRLRQAIDSGRVVGTDGRGARYTAAQKDRRARRGTAPGGAAKVARGRAAQPDAFSPPEIGRERDRIVAEVEAARRQQDRIGTLFSARLGRADTAFKRQFRAAGQPGHTELAVVRANADGRLPRAAAAFNEAGRRVKDRQSALSAYDRAERRKRGEDPTANTVRRRMDQLGIGHLFALGSTRQKSMWLELERKEGLFSRLATDAGNALNSLQYRIAARMDAAKLNRAAAAVNKKPMTAEEAAAAAHSARFRADQYDTHPVVTVTEPGAKPRPKTPPVVIARGRDNPVSMGAPTSTFNSGRTFADALRAPLNASAAGVNRAKLDAEALAARVVDRRRARAVFAAADDNKRPEDAGKGPYTWIRK